MLVYICESKAFYCLLNRVSIRAKTLDRNIPSLMKYLPKEDRDDDDDMADWPARNGFRFMNKNGRINIHYSSMGRVKHMHANIILFIMQAKWWMVLTLVLFGFIVSWFFFAFLYFLVSIEHGDFVLNEDEQILLDNGTNFTRPYAKVQQEMCVKEVHNFLSALLFSIETQHTIGYGSRYITTECLGGILVLTLQSSLGYLLQVIVTQIVFSKLSRPTGRENGPSLRIIRLMFQRNHNSWSSVIMR